MEKKYCKDCKYVRIMPKQAELYLFCGCIKNEEVKSEYTGLVIVKREYIKHSENNYGDCEYFVNCVDLSKDQFEDDIIDQGD